MTRRPKSIIGIMSRVDDLFYLDSAYVRGYYAGQVAGMKWMQALKGVEPMFSQEPRSPFKRLMKHYEKQLKRLEKQK